MNTVYFNATFITSASRVEDAPEDIGKEIAFAGRSNAGKSSVLNTLANQKALARTSKTPGRTQLLNFFQIQGQRRFVDLPGFGYANVPLAVKRQWHTMIEKYLTQRLSLCGIVLVMDVRHPLTEFDQQMITWCKHGSVPLHILLSKADKLNFGAAKNTLFTVQRQLQEALTPVSAQLFSSLKRVGIDDIHQVLDAWFFADKQTQ